MASRALKIICLCLPVLLCGAVSYGQNTKGDRPSGATRETRFKTPKKSAQKRPFLRRARRGDDKAARQAAPVTTRTRKGERAGRPVNPLVTGSKPGNKQRPWQGDITGRRIRPRTSPANTARKVYPQPPTVNYSSRAMNRSGRGNINPNVRRVQRMQQRERRVQVGRPIRPVYSVRKPRERQRPWRGDITGRRIRTSPASRTAAIIHPQPANTGFSSDGLRRRAYSRDVKFQARPVPRSNPNIYSRKNLYQNNRSIPPPRFQDYGRNSALAKARRYPAPGGAGVSGRRIAPKSASGSYIARRSTNTWAHFPRPKRKQVVTTKDLAGKKLRGRNFETRRPVLINPTANYRPRRAAGDRAYKGPAEGGYVSRTRPGERPWRGDVAGWPIRGIKKIRPSGQVGIQRGGYKSGTVAGEKRPGADPVPVRPPGIAAHGMWNYRGFSRAGKKGFGNQGEEFTGNLKSRRPEKGGGSRSGRLWNNSNTPIAGRIPGGDRAASFQGNIRAGGKIFNNQGEEFSGNIKFRRPEKGGGSRSGKLWNNNNTPVAGRIPGGDRAASFQGNIRAGGKVFNNQGEEFSGNIKSRRPEKGGGSRSGKLWNNDNTPIAGRIPGGDRAASFQGNIRAGGKVFRNQGEEFSGSMKARRPDKGGGSVSGKLWNNEQSPIPVRVPANTRIASFQGNIRAGGKVFSNQGEEFSGNIKARRSDKGGGSVSGKLWNNEESPIAVRVPSNTRIASFQGNVRAGGKSFRNQGEEFSGAMKAKRPAKGGGSVSGELWNNSETPIDVRVAKNNQGSAFRGKTKAADYGRNPNSAEGAQPVRNPGKAFARSTQFQGNVRMNKFELFGHKEEHPDTKYVKLNKNNVDEEKDMLTNLKLWWERLFRKSETQPDHLKEKGRKPRYDKGESGMWYE